MSIKSSFVSSPQVSLDDYIDLQDTQPFAITPLDNKKSTTKSKSQEKADSLGIDLSNYGTQGDSGDRSRVENLLRGAGSSLVNMVGNAYDFGSLVDDKIADYRGVDRTQKSQLFDPLSEAKVADSITGFDRTRLQQGQEQLEQQVAQGDYLGAVGSAFSVAPEYIATSASAPVEFAAGGVVTKALGGMLKVMGGAKALDTLNKVSPTAGLVVDKTAQALKLPAGASVYAANAVARDVEEYAVNNNGEEPSVDWIAKNFLAKSLTGIIQKEIITGGAKAAASSVTLGSIKDIAKVIGGQSAAKILGQNMYRNGKLVVGTAFFESLQEVAEGLTTQVATQTDSAKYPELDTVAKTITAPKNVDKTIVNAITGGTTGAVTTAVPAVASTSGITGALATRGVASTVGKKIVKEGTKVIERGKDKAADKSFSYLHQDQKDEINAKYDAEDKVYQDLKTTTEQENQDLGKIATLNQLKASDNASIQADLETYKDKLDNPKVIKKIVNRAIAQNNKLITSSKVALESARAGDTVYKAAQRAKEFVPEDLQEKVEKAAEATVEFTKDAYGVVLDEVQHLETSTARAIYDDIGNKKTYKEIGQYLDKNIHKITGNDFEALVELTKSNEKMQSVIKDYKSRVDKAKDHLGITTKEVVSNLDNYKYIPKPDVTTSTGTHTLARELFDLAGKNFKDPEVFAKVKSAVEAYKSSEYADKTTAKAFDRLLKTGDKTKFFVPTDLDTVKENAEVAGEKIKSFWKATEKFSKKATKDLVKNIDEYLAEQTFNKDDVRNNIARLMNDVELNENEHKYFINRILTKRKVYQKKRLDPTLKGKSKLTNVEAMYATKYPERIKAAEDKIKELGESLEKAKTKAKADAETTPNAEPTTAGYAKDMDTYAKDLIAGDSGTKDFSIEPAELDNFIMYVEIQQGKGDPISEAMETAYNLPDIKEYRDNKDDIIPLNDQGTSVDAPSKAPTSKEEIKLAADRLKAGLKEAGVEIC